MAGLEFRVLGRVEVLRGGEEVTVGRSGTLNLLAGLLLSANTLVAGDALVEVAWGEAQPAHPRAALHNKISRLRQLLRDETIQTVGDAYRLRADVSELDLLQFDSLVSQAQTAACEEDTAAALAAAIGLWRGDPLANTDSLALASEATPRLIERYLMAWEQWAQVSLRLGRAAEVVQRGIPLVGAHLFRERIVRTLMLAFYHEGRTADALTIYDGLRRRLREELGADPGAALQDLHAAILRGTPLKQGSPNATQPRPPRRVFGGLTSRDSASLPGPAGAPALSHRGNTNLLRQLR